METLLITLRIFPLALFAATLAFTCSVTLAVGQGSAVAKPELATLTSRDATFQVKYPQYLVRCEHLDAENPDVWSPEGACVASIPVCDSSGHAGNVLGCLAYPMNDFHGSELQAASLAVSLLDSFGTAGECMRNWTNRDTSNVHEERIRGVRFQAAKVAEMQGSYVAEHSAYRVFHKGACYELDINVSTALATAFAAEDAPRKLTPAERDKIKASLTEALEGFRFLK
ncbi:MAG: hypothetical protein WB729_21895 [Candidatus Sulfotelmatobacter sp.]